MAALAFCHERGVAHGALGAACFLLSTFDDRRAGELVVKLDNFGFARMLRRPLRASSSEGARTLCPQYAHGMCLGLAPAFHILMTPCDGHSASETGAKLHKGWLCAHATWAYMQQACGKCVT